MGGDLTDDVAAAIEELPSMPETLLQLRRAVAHPCANFATVVPLLGQDPGLSADILKFANSARYGATHTVTTLEQAVGYIGMTHLAEYVTSAFATQCMAKSFAGLSGIDAYLVHSQRISHGTRVLVANCSISRESADTFVLIALLHDIGKLVMATLLSPSAAALAGVSPSEMEKFAASEKAMCGLNHCDVGAEICRHWHFPDLYEDCIRRHHTPIRGGDICTGAVLVFLSHMLDAEFAEEEFISIFSAQQLRNAGLDCGNLRRAFREWQHHVAECDMQNG
jgi:putative nucleotidyltransferase with HDIG domain